MTLFFILIIFSVIVGSESGMNIDTRVPNFGLVETLFLRCGCEQASFCQAGPGISAVLLQAVQEG